MNCNHVLDLIDAGPLADTSPADVEAARQHARTCATCGPAFAAAARITTDLAELSHPAPPVEMAAIILARINRIDPIDADASAVSAINPASLRAWLATAAMCAGMLVAYGVFVLGPFAVVFHFAQVGIRGIASGQATWETLTTAVLLLAVGVVVYAGGLFASVHEPRAQRGRAG